MIAMIGPIGSQPAHHDDPPPSPRASTCVQTTLPNAHNTPHTCVFGDHQGKLEQLIASGKIVKDELDEGAIMQLKQVRGGGTNRFVL